LGKRDSASVIDRANNGGDELSKLQRKRRTDIDLIKLEQQESAGTKRVKKDDESDVEVSISISLSFLIRDLSYLLIIFIRVF
jgi:hypothetical protein